MWQTWFMERKMISELIKSSEWNNLGWGKIPKIQFCHQWLKLRISIQSDYIVLRFNMFQHACSTIPHSTTYRMNIKWTCYYYLHACHLATTTITFLYSPSDWFHWCSCSQPENEAIKTIRHQYRWHDRSSSLPLDAGAGAEPKLRK